MQPAGSEIDADGDKMMLLAKASQRGTAGAESPLVMSRDLEAGASEGMQCRICLESDNGERINWGVRALLLARRGLPGQCPWATPRLTFCLLENWSSALVS